MNALLTSSETSPHLSLKDLENIKIPVELFNIVSLDFCREHKILPLRYDEKSGILSFIFVDSKALAELETLQTEKTDLKLSAFRVEAEVFNTLLRDCELWQPASQDQLKTVALIESDPLLQSAFRSVLRSQGFEVLLFATLEHFQEKMATEDEDELLLVAERRKAIPFQFVLVRASSLEIPEDFCHKIWSQFGSIRILLLSEKWLENLFEKSIASANELEFHLKHEDYYHAAMDCLNAGNIFQAIEYLEKVGPANSHFQKAKMVLGKAFLKKKNYNKAVLHFQTAYDHWAEEPDAVLDEPILKLMYHLAYTLEKLHRFSEALKLYERVSAENPLFKEVGSRLARVKEIQRKADSNHEKREGRQAFSKKERPESRYERLDQIGRGGMGTVYRARDRVLGREVALKILNSHFKHDEKIVETFLREAKSLAALNHLHIVTIFDAGIELENYYISMEFIEGRTVRELLKRKGHFRIPTALALSKQVLKALAYAHSKKVIHRDITTNNLMLTETKIIKLMDFGLARVVNQLHSEQSIIGGTPYFMSPEQVEGAPIDHRTDIYSFGVCLFEMISGQVPFPMDNPGYHHIHTKAPDLLSLKSEIPREVGDVVAKCLEKRPADRFQNADEILDALKKLPQDSDMNRLSQPSLKPSMKVKPT